MPEHSLSARRLAAHLRGALTVALGTVTAGGEPRVAPIGAVFVGGRFHVPTVAESARARHLARRPAASLTYFEGTDLAVIAHGRAETLAESDPGFAEADEVLVEAGQQSPREWNGRAIFLRLEPASVFTYAREPPRPSPSR
jgi:Pyridoxamine 5'-phosphate oxidase